MDIFDKNGVQRDMAWLRQKYGNVQFLDAGPGKKFKLARVDETEGPAVIKVRVLNEQGLPQAGQPVANHWPAQSLQPGNRPDDPGRPRGSTRSAFADGAKDRTEALWINHNGVVQQELWNQA